MFTSILPSWFPVKGAGQYHGSIGFPSFTASASAGTSLTRSRTNSRSDNHRNLQNLNRNTHHHQANLLINSAFHHHQGIVAATTVKIISTTIPATAVLISDSLESIFDTAIVEKLQPEIITEF